MEAAARAMEEATKSAEAASEVSRTQHRDAPHPRKLVSLLPDEPPSKRLAIEEDRLMAQMHVMRSAHMKITSRGAYSLILEH
jgi:hypothetical protein